MEKKCPHCGEMIPEEAAFCPHCAQSVNQRAQATPPRRMSRRVRNGLLAGLIAAVVVVLAAMIWWNVRSKVYDNNSTEVIYTDGGVDYQLCIAWSNAPSQPANRERTGGTFQLDEKCRYPSLLYINLAETGESAAGAFLERVESITGEITDVDEGWELTCTEAELNSSTVPGSAAMIYIDALIHSVGSHSAELTISVEMKNGDVIRLHQTQIMEGVMTHDFTADDAPMDTVADLEALLKKIEATVDPADKVNIHLPPVTYTEELRVAGRPVNLIGTQDETGSRTTFTQPVQLEMMTNQVLEWEKLDFIGPGTGTGLSVAARVHLTDCHISGWDTGVLAHTKAWVRVVDSVFEDNGVGLHFNAERGAPSNTWFRENVFRNNGTAVLLEQVPQDMVSTLHFDQCRFFGNGADIDNRCGQDVDTSTAIFE